MYSIVKEKKMRNSGVELLRIICMFGFVCLHIIGYSSIAPFGSNEYESRFLLHLRYLLNVGVDVFAFISGFYGIKFSIRKALNLLYIGVFSSLFVFVAEIYFFNIKFNILNIVQIFFSNWYFREYLILFFLSPFLNIYLNQNDKEYKTIFIPIIVLFIWNFLSTQFPSSFGQTNSLGNHSAMLLIMIYILGRLLYITKKLENINLWILICMTFICLPITFCFNRLKEFSSPFCIISAICLFEIFRRISIPIAISKIACFLSPSMLGILILHNAGSNQMSGGLVHRYFNNHVIHLSVTKFFEYAIIIFITALIVDLIRRLLLFIFIKLIDFLQKIINCNI